MNITIKPDLKSVGAVDLLVVPLGAGKAPFGQIKLDKRTSEQLTELKKRARLKGKVGESAVAHVSGRSYERLGLIGVGADALDAAGARRLVAKAVRQATAERAASVAVVFDAMPTEGLESVAAAATEGALLAGYRFDRYKAKTRVINQPPKKISLVFAADADLRVARGGLRAGTAAAQAALFARDLVNEPASTMTPSRLVEAAKEVAVDGIELTVYDQAKLEKMKAGGLLAVARGSDEPPYMVHLTYRPAGTPKAKVCVVGKGLTFDSGGLSLKPSDAMEDMKIDMAGAAAVLGLFRALPQIAPDVEVHGIAAFCENMPSGKAVKPGDVVTTMSGRTVEVLNTDAEGRVTLADTLHYATELKPDYIIDLATLTGACMVALGQEYAGLFSNSDDLAEKVGAASAAAGEFTWRLPLPVEYEGLLKSQIADLRNIGTTRYGGAITAGLFLQNFVGGRPWLHLDIAGPAWAEKDSVPHQPKGATGFGVRTVLEFLRNIK
jgi:leucyl aminopeptidase